ncbi:MAG: SAM-dependent methyltransferase [Niastella sp.]|nr:SAM-dependent methyltransferase [Niastella sp.]
MSQIFLIPALLSDDGINNIPPEVLPAIKNCPVLFAENIRTARRYLKKLDPTIIIDDFEWFEIHKAEQEQVAHFRSKINEGKNIGIISEAGCPGVADPGQILIGIAQQMNCKVIPLTGPSSILLALMASGMNGQQFEFVGYLPLDSNERSKKIKSLEADSQLHNSTKIFIETPYRNHSLLDALLKNCRPQTLLCIAVNITAKKEMIKTKTVAAWKKEELNLHKIPTIFLLYSGI